MRDGHGIVRPHRPRIVALLAHTLPFGHSLLDQGPPVDGEQRRMMHFDFQVDDLDFAVSEGRGPRSNRGRAPLWPVWASLAVSLTTAAGVVFGYVRVRDVALPVAGMLAVAPPDRRRLPGGTADPGAGRHVRPAAGPSRRPRAQPGDPAGRKPCLSSGLSARLSSPWSTGLSARPCRSGPSTYAISCSRPNTPGCTAK